MTFWKGPVWGRGPASSPATAASASAPSGIIFSRGSRPAGFWSGSGQDLNGCADVHHVPDGQHVAIAEGDAAVGPVLLILYLKPIVDVVGHAVDHDHAAGVEARSFGLGSVLAVRIGDAQRAEIVALGIAPVDVVDAFRCTVVSLIKLMADGLLSQLDREVSNFLPIGKELQVAFALVHQNVVGPRALHFAGCGERKIALLNEALFRLGWRWSWHVCRCRQSQQRSEAKCYDISQNAHRHPPRQRSVYFATRSHPRRSTDSLPTSRPCFQCQDATCGCVSGKNRLGILCGARRV